MRKRITIALFLFLMAMPMIFANEAIPFGYNRLYGDGDSVPVIPGFNYSINVNHSSTSGIANHSLTSDLAHDSLLFNDYSLFNYMNGYVRAQELVCFLSGGSDCTMEGDIDYAGNDALNIGDITGTGNINMTGSEARQTIGIQNTNPFGTARMSVMNEVGSASIFVKLGSMIPQSIINGFIFGGNSSGIFSEGVASGNNLFLMTSGNNSIIFGNTPDGNATKSNFTLAISPADGSVVFQGDKRIVPKIADGGYALVFDSDDVLEAGAFPFVFEAQDSDNETIILSWQQNGANNSFSGQLNSFVTFPKAWMLSTNPSMDTDNVTFLFNTSNYPQLCEWLQTNLSLVPEDCKYYADTTGRGVPMFATGDAEIWRTMTVHEGTTLFNTFDFITRVGNDANFFFNNMSGGKVHIRDNREIQANFSDLNQSICNFDDGTLCGANIESIAPEAGRDWRNVLELQCHQDRCARADGGNTKVISVNDNTIGISNINVSFWLTSVMSGGDSLTINLDDNQGNDIDVLTITTTELDTQQSFVFPALYENKLNITTTYIFIGQNTNRIVWLDNIRANVDFDPAILFNESYEGGHLVLGEDRGSLSCGMEVFKEENTESVGTHWVTEIGCPDGETRIIGNTSFVDVTLENQTIIGDQLITGDLTVDGEIIGYINETEIADTYVPYSGADKNTILGLYNLTANYFFGDGSQLSGITKTLEETLIKGDDANGQDILGVNQLDVGTLQLNDNFITDSTGTIDFGNEVLTTTGNINIGGSTNYIGRTTGSNILQVNNPGIGSTSTIKFDKTNDRAEIRVTETASDQTTFQFYMSDNPQTTADKFNWYMDSYRGPGADWKPLEFTGYDAFLNAETINLNGNIEIMTDPYYSANGNAGTYEEVTSGTMTINSIDVSGYDGTGGQEEQIMIEIDGTGSPNTYSLSRNTWGNVVSTGNIITGSPQNVFANILIDFSATTGGVSGDRWSFNVWQGGALNNAGDYIGTGNVTATYFIGNASFMTGIPETDISGLVPYTGATSDVDLGVYGLTAKTLTADGGTGASELIIIADSDNSNEADTAKLSLSQDGDLITGSLGFDSSNNLLLDHTGVSGAWGVAFARNGVKQLGTDGGGNAYATNNFTANYFFGDGSFITGITKTIAQVLSFGNDAQGEDIINLGQVNATSFYSNGTKVASYELNQTGSNTELKWLR